MLKGCLKLDKAITISDGVINCKRMFFDCKSLSKTIETPKSVVYTTDMFYSTKITGVEEEDDYI